MLWASEPIARRTPASCAALAIESFRSSRYIDPLTSKAAPLDCRIKHAFEIHLQGLARTNQAAGWMRQNIEVRIGEGVEQAARRLVLILAKKRMNRRDNDIEPGKNLVGIVQFAICKDVDLGSDQDVRSPASPSFPEPLYFLDLLFQTIQAQPTGDALRG
jgi:hypothetical protein